MNTSQVNIVTREYYRSSKESNVLDDSLEEYQEELTSSAFDFRNDETQESFLFVQGLRKSALDDVVKTIGDNESILDKDDSSEEKSINNLDKIS